MTEPAPGQGPLVGMIAGEASGDTLGAAMIEALRARIPGVRFAGIAGPRMLAAGCTSWHDQERLAVRGLFEVLRHVPELLRIRRDLVRRLLDARPSVVVGIDSPDFTLGVERRVRARGVPTVHCVSPTVWAWRPGRIEGIRKAVDHMLVLFPFEERHYREAGIPATCIGHPLADQLEHGLSRDAARAGLHLAPSAQVIALLPGSRRSEIEMMAPVFIDTALLLHRADPSRRFVAPFATAATQAMFGQLLRDRHAQDLPVTLLEGRAHEALAAADAVLVASGTATLEAALIGRPMVIAYRLSRATHAIARRLVRIPHVGLPNILARQALCPEFLQDDATPANLAQALCNLLDDAPLRAALTQRLEGLRAELALGAAQRAATVIASYVERHGQVA